MTQTILSTSHSVQTMLRWFLVFTKPSGEETARVNLEQQGYRTYYPRLLRSSLHRGRWMDRVVSLFPRYLFVQIDTAMQSLAPVRSTLGVANIVRFGAESTVVPDGIVDGLMRRADPESGLHRVCNGQRFSGGARVNVVGGAFEGLEGIFERDAGDERVIVLLKLLGQSTPVRIPAHYVIPDGYS